MIYPKPLMTISGLVEMGYPRRKLEELVYSKGFPSRRLSNDGNWYIDTEAFERWLEVNGLKNDIKMKL